MASIIDCFKDSINEDLALVKIIVYALPIYVGIRLYVTNQLSSVTIGVWIALALLYLGLMTKGVNNVRMGKNSVLTLNPFSMLLALAKALVVIVPQAIVLGAIGHFVVMFLVSIPVAWDYYNLTIMIIVWSILGSILLTSFLSFAKYLRIVEGYNLVVICESCIDVFIQALFFIPQVAIVDLVVFWPIYYLFKYFNGLGTWGYHLFISLAIIINFSMFVNYLAQASYEQIKGNNEDYDDNYNKIDMIDDAAERLNGH